MLLELKAPQGAPARCLACLSARPARVRLTAARALERFSDPQVFREFVVQLVNDRGKFFFQSGSGNSRGRNIDRFAFQRLQKLDNSQNAVTPSGQISAESRKSYEIHPGTLKSHRRSC